MIVSKCPVRVSLVGGSSDLEEYLKEYIHGAVISFPCNLYTYITIHENNRNKFIVNCTNPEEVGDWREIKNDIVRVAFEHFRPASFLSVGFNSDIFSVGSGMATSSSYLIAMIKAMSVYTQRDMSDFDICKLALFLERKFNPLTGQQDPYGCGIAGLKKISFQHNQDPSFEYISSTFLEGFDMYLLYTGKSRASTDILKSIDVKKIVGVKQLVDRMHTAMTEDDKGTFLDIIRKGWSKKKQTSSSILSDDLSIIDKKIQENAGVLAHKLCGAGGGGHFLIFCTEGAALPTLPNNLEKRATKITISMDGLSAWST